MTLLWRKFWTDYLWQSGEHKHNKQKVSRRRAVSPQILAECVRHNGQLGCSPKLTKNVIVTNFECKLFKGKFPRDRFFHSQCRLHLLRARATTPRWRNYKNPTRNPISDRLSISINKSTWQFGVVATEQRCRILHCGCRLKGYKWFRLN